MKTAKRKTKSKTKPAAKLPVAKKPATYLTDLPIMRLAVKAKAKPKLKPKGTKMTFKAKKIPNENSAIDVANALREGDDPVDLEQLEHAVADPTAVEVVYVPTTEALQMALVPLVDGVLAVRVPPPPVTRSKGGKASAREGEAMVDPAAVEWSQPADDATRRQLYIDRIVAAPVETALRAAIRLLGEELFRRGQIPLLEATLLAVWQDDQAKRAVMDLTWNGVGGEWWSSKQYQIPE